ncbi:MAG: ABC transporter substrate-binding protein, partial [Actinomycetota bacterium]
QELRNYVRKTIGKPCAGKPHARFERGMRKRARKSTAPLTTNDHFLNQPNRRSHPPGVHHRPDRRGLLAACGRGDERAAQDGAVDGARTVKEPGKTPEITGVPVRVIALDGGFDLEALCTLGITPIAAGENTYDETAGAWPTYITDQCDLAGTELVRGRQLANVEQIAALKPDLIVAVEFYAEQEIFPLLEAIAPVILIDRIAGTGANACGRPGCGE